jgi:aryl-alcohol dehydrogenase-like predicted oxidoreductase
MTEGNYDKLSALEAWSAAHGHTLTELAHTWLLAHPEVSSVISGATSSAQLLANAKSADWSLTAAELAEVNLLLDSPPL